MPRALLARNITTKTRSHPNYFKFSNGRSILGRYNLVYNSVAFNSRSRNYLSFFLTVNCECGGLALPAGGDVLGDAGVVGGV